MGDKIDPLYSFTSKLTSSAYRLRRLETGAPRLRRGQFSPTVGEYTRLPATAIGNGGVTPISSTFIKKGAVAPAGNTAGFAFTSTTGSITWYWDGTNGSQIPVLTRSDRSKFVIPTSGSPLAITGLAANTTYYFLPFWSPNNLCNIGWVQGTTGSPQIAFVVADTTDLVQAPSYLMGQNFEDREALSAGFMSASTTAAGTGGGGAGGGGAGGRCVMAGTDIETLGDIPYTVHIYPETEWVLVRVKDGRELTCTHNHPLYHTERGRVQADMLESGDIVLMDNGEQEVIEVRWFERKCSKWQIEMPEGHIFFANGFMSHNFKPF